jgi:ferric-dicitrate binding protein FerR (iron transport regulator)
MNNINEIITRVLSGEASSEEMQELLFWFRQNESNPKEFAQYEMLWNALEIIGRKNEFNTERAYQKFNDYLEGTHDHVKPISLFARISRIAAIVLIASGISFLAGYYVKPKVQESNAFCQIVTPKGSKTFVELSDGTKVWLNAESKLKYPEKFDKELRNVYLEGEGYFEVAKDKKRPFIVHTSKIDVRAVGTAFNVKSYDSEDIIQTTLVEGSVIIEKKTNAKKQASNNQENTIALLKPHQQATFYKSNSTIDISSKTAVIKTTETLSSQRTVNTIKKDSLLLEKEVNTELFTAWKDNKLMFDNEPFESLSIKLERRFNMKFIFKDNEIKAFRFTGHFNEISVEQFLEALQFASPFNFVIDKNNVYISNKPLKIEKM